MTITTTSPATTPADLRARAAAHDTEAYESFQRCDTDGALSQWGHGLNAQKDRLAAEIAENGGKSEFPALFDTDGNLVAAKLVDGRYGMVWGILGSDDPRGRFVAWFNPSKANKNTTAYANDTKKGYRVGYVLAPAEAEFGGGNICTVMAYARRTDGGFSRDVEIVDNGTNFDTAAYYHVMDLISGKA